MAAEKAGQSYRFAVNDSTTDLNVNPTIDTTLRVPDKEDPRGVSYRYAVSDDCSVPDGSSVDFHKSTDDILEVEENTERGQWGGSAEFILSCLGYAVGLGNVWRFPYLCYSNGGGAFLIPYFIMLTFVGLPIFFIELTMGQYAAEGPMTVFECCPLFQGVGAGMVIISFLGSIYYNMIIAWSLYYMFASFTSDLPWVGCFNPWNTDNCWSKREADVCEFVNKTVPTGSIWLYRKCINETMQAGINYTALKENLTASKSLVSPSEEYFNRRMLDRTDSIEDMGGLKWELCLVLLLAWVLCFLCIIKGIKSSGKAVYFTATFPYLVLVILFFRGVTLDGAGEGVKFYLIPKWEKLAEPKVWADAAGQIFFSLSVGMGGLMTFSSYNKFHNNVLRDTLIVALGNCLTSFFAGFVVFSILGFMAKELGKEVKDVVASGSGLAFVAYPEVVSRLPVSPLWAILFFLMLLLLGLDSQFAGLENIQTAIVDMIPKLRPKKTWVAAGLCIFMYLLGLTMCAQGGIFWEELMSYYSSGWSLVLIGLAEGIVFPWVYGADNILKNLEHMLKSPQSKYWWVVWKFISPVLLFAILIANFIEFTGLTYGSYVFPDWANAIGWLMALSSVVVIPIFAVFNYVRSAREGESLGRRFIRLCKPTEKWLPAIEKNRRRLEEKKRLEKEMEASSPTLYTVSSDDVRLGGESNLAYSATGENGSTNSGML